VTEHQGLQCSKALLFSLILGAQKLYLVMQIL
jgi:hypothetical protein